MLFAENELNRRAYQQMTDGALPEAIALFRLNAEAFPASANTWDSLGEALLAAGDREGAKAAYEKALAVDPATPSAKAASNGSSRDRARRRDSAHRARPHLVRQDTAPGGTGPRCPAGVRDPERQPPDETRKRA